MPIQISSLKITRIPHSLKKLVIPIGETSITFHGKKYRVTSKGEKKATPKPPLVSASNIECERVQLLKKRKRRKPFLLIKDRFL